jgi:hypothetical protein
MKVLSLLQCEKDLLPLLLGQKLLLCLLNVGTNEEVGGSGRWKTFGIVLGPW